MSNNYISFDEIHSNFRTLAKKIHPDLNPNDPLAAEKFNLLKKEYTKCLNRMNSIRLAISLQDSILGCERFFMSNDGKQNYRLIIPSGVIDGQTLRYRNVQLDSNNFSILMVKIKIELPKNYLILGGKLINKVRLSILKFLIGGEITITGPDGSRFRITVPARVKDKSIFRITGEGLYNKETKKRDDLYLQIISFFS